MATRYEEWNVQKGGSADNWEQSSSNQQMSTWYGYQKPNTDSDLESNIYSPREFHVLESGSCQHLDNLSSEHMKFTYDGCDSASLHSQHTSNGPTTAMNMASQLYAAEDTHDNSFQYEYQGEHLVNSSDGYEYNVFANQDDHTCRHFNENFDNVIQQQRQEQSDRSFTTGYNYAPNFKSEVLIPQQSDIRRDVSTEQENQPDNGNISTGTNSCGRIDTTLNQPMEQHDSYVEQLISKLPGHVANNTSPDGYVDVLLAYGTSESVGPIRNTYVSKSTILKPSLVRRTRCDNSILPPPEKIKQIRELSQMDGEKIRINLCERLLCELLVRRIPQGKFAKIVLGKAEGTFSDLVRFRKHWDKLKSGRQPYEKMKA